MPQSPDSEENDDACSRRQDFFQDFRRALGIFNEMWGLLREQRSPSPIARHSALWSPVLSRFCCNCTLSALATWASLLPPPPPILILCSHTQISSYPPQGPSVQESPRVPDASPRVCRWLPLLLLPLCQCSPPCPQLYPVISLVFISWLSNIWPGVTLACF